jgi:hypothetical protein
MKNDIEGVTRNIHHILCRLHLPSSFMYVPCKKCPDLDELWTAAATPLFSNAHREPAFARASPPLCRSCSDFNEASVELVDQNISTHEGLRQGDACCSPTYPIYCELPRPPPPFVPYEQTPCLILATRDTPIPSCQYLHPIAHPSLLPPSLCYCCTVLSITGGVGSRPRDWPAHSSSVRFRPFL